MVNSGYMIAQANRNPKNDLAEKRQRSVSLSRRRERPVSSEPVFSRVIDITVAVILLVFLAPLMLFIAIGVWVSNPGPIFFAHRRIGRGGRVFHCLKFRTMATDAERRLKHILATDPAARAEWQRDFKLRNDPRVFGFGRILRKSSLDELPQLFNVLRGDMSLVGPRPITEDEVHRYGRYFSYYCAVRPGITGLWQISGRNDVSYRRRIAFDVVYARHRRPQLDFLIMLRTIPSVLFASGSY